MRVAWSAGSFGACVILFGGFFLASVGCNSSGDDSATDDATVSANADTSEVHAAETDAEQTDASGSEDANPQAAGSREMDRAGYFREVTEKVGIPVSDELWPAGTYLTPEITPGGVALLDYDNDGDLDIYQICHGPPALPPKAFKILAPNRLFRQDAGKFVEVPDAAGLNDAGYGHGAAVRCI